MKYTSKTDLVEDIEGQHARLMEILGEVPQDQYEVGGVWGDGWSIKDLIAHLTEWLNLFHGWHEAGLQGRTPHLPSPGYKWSETPTLNRAIWAKHQAKDVGAVLRDFDRAHSRVLSLIKSLAPPDLLEPGRFAWTGKNPLITYVGANTASHYRFGIRVLKRWRRRRSQAENGANGG